MQLVLANPLLPFRQALLDDEKFEPCYQGTVGYHQI